MNIGTRIRELRKELSMSQTEFGARIGLKQAVIGQMEHGTRNITDRTISLICQRFHVCEQWIRFGTGAKYIETDSSMLAQLIDEYQMSELDAKIIKCFLQLSPAQRNAMHQYIYNLVEEFSQNPPATKPPDAKNPTR